MLAEARGVIVNKQRGFTLVELLIVIAIIAILMAIMIPALQAIKEQGKRAVCIMNMEQLTFAWILYANDNEDSIVCGDTGEYDTYNPYGNNYHRGEIPWVLKDWHSNATQAEKRDAILNGAMYEYSKNIELYKCPTGMPGELRTYAIVDAMNCKDWLSRGDMPGSVMIKKRMKIRGAQHRFVFLDDGGAGGAHLGGWTCFVKKDEWWDPPPVRHSGGTNFSFADGHGEFWKWEDQRTVKYGRWALANNDAFSSSSPYPDQSNNPDLYNCELACWGPAAARP